MRRTIFETKSEELTGPSLAIEEVSTAHSEVLGPRVIDKVYKGSWHSEVRVYVAMLAIGFHLVKI